MPDILEYVATALQVDEADLISARARAALIEDMPEWIITYILEYEE